MIIDEYALRIDSLVGKGAHGDIIEAMHIRTNERFVAKRIDVSTTAGFRNFCNERDHLHQLSNSNNIVKVVKSVLQQKYGYLVMERMETDLMTCIESCSLTSEQRNTIFLQIVQAVSACHSNGIAHLDLKPDNVLINIETMEVKLCDFGLSKFFASDGMVVEATGTIPYIAPELCKKWGEKVDARKADIWSLAILYHVLLSDLWPFQSGNEEELLKAVKKGEICFHRKITNEQRSLISAMTCKDPKARLSIDKVLLRLTTVQRESSPKQSPAKRIAEFLLSKGARGKAQLRNLPFFNSY